MTRPLSNSGAAVLRFMPRNPDTACLPANCRLRCLKFAGGLNPASCSLSNIKREDCTQKRIITNYAFLTLDL